MILSLLPIFIIAKHHNSVFEACNDLLIHVILSWISYIVSVLQGTISVLFSKKVGYTKLTSSLFKLYVCHVFKSFLHTKFARSNDRYSTGNESYFLFGAPGTILSLLIGPRGSFLKNKVLSVMCVSFQPHCFHEFFFIFCIVLLWILTCFLLPYLFTKDMYQTC